MNIEIDWVSQLRHKCTSTSRILTEHDLHHLNGPFTKEDIDDIIKNMPPDKSPVADGFNDTFLKKCWHIIKDIYDLCFDFFNDIVDIHPINNVFITLVPKVNTPTIINDFTPISLLNCITKNKFFEQCTAKEAPAMV
jgi:hypothetical protein